jgi:hypothetical protein
MDLTKSKNSELRHSRPLLENAARLSENHAYEGAQVDAT